MLVPAVENAISGNAYRPGDVIHTRKGLNIEIGNTDAEGRMVLCDALAYAVEQKPRTIIDFATLTGAARVALGPELPALFANDEKLAARLLDCAARRGRSHVAHAALARLPAPLRERHRRLQQFRPGGFAGAIVGALFLDYFVPDDIAWAHFDVLRVERREPPGPSAGWRSAGIARGAGRAHLTPRC